MPPWQVRTSEGFEGVMRIDEDALYFQSTFAQSSAGGHDWEDHGSTKPKLIARPKVGLVFIFANLLVGTHLFLHDFLSWGLLLLIFGVTGLAGFVYIFLLEARIPLSSIEGVSIDESGHEVTISYQPVVIHIFISEIGGWNTGTATFTFPTAADVRDVRELLRSRGVSLDNGDEQTATETVYRVVVENGVYFCESCERQVSPTDSTCPSCGYALRDERTIEVDSRDDGDEQTATETDYRVVVENGVYFCESCGRQVSPADSTCPSCGYALRTERSLETERQ